MARILVVDVDPACRYSLRLALEVAGHVVGEAGTGKEALSLQAWYPADVVVTDVVMPAREGLETISALRRVFPDLPVIALSGSRRDDVISDALKVGANMAFRKPFPNETLVAAVGSVLRPG
jgi:DNA-binding NarL/FixJ family response regulator